MFEMALCKSIHDERQNQLRWQVKLGSQPISMVEKIGIDDYRIISKEEYNVGNYLRYDCNKLII